jgi:hypothetical protein
MAQSQVEQSMTEEQPDAIEHEHARVQRVWDLCAEDPYQASPGSKFEKYGVQVDHERPPTK